MDHKAYEKFNFSKVLNLETVKKLYHHFVVLHVILLLHSEQQISYS